MIQRDWESFVFRPGPARDLGILRVVVCGWFAFHLVVFDVAALADLPAAVWEPPFFLGFLESPPDPGLISGAWSALWILAIGATAGVFTRVTVPLCAMAALVVFGVAEGYGLAGGVQSGPSILCLGILACSACGSAVSWDSRRRTSHGTVDFRYGWPVRMVQIVLPAFMVCAGIHKVMGSWPADPGRQISWFLQFKLHVDGPGKGIELSDGLLWLARSPSLCAVLGYATLGFELLCPLAILPSRALRAVLVGGLLAIQVGIAVLTQTFATLPWLPLYAAWVPWTEVWGRVSRRRPDTAWARP